MSGSDPDFIDAFRTCVESYFAAVDKWEAVYGRYHRMPDAPRRGSDLAVEQREFEDRRCELEKLLPRARALCFKHGQTDAFAGLLYVPLGRHAPQHRTDSAISRGERRAVLACLTDLRVACREWDAGLPTGVRTDAHRPTLVDRILAFFA